jgi:hypothetical protein
LAFHPYPQLIRAVFNLQRFGPPFRVTGTSSWPWVAHSVSGLLHVTMVALFRLAFASVSPLNGLALQHTSNSLAHYAKGTPSSRRIGTPTDCKHTVSGTISLSSQEYFSPFPHGTGSLSVTREYLALDGGPPRFPQDFTCPAVLGNLVQEDRSFSPTGLSPPMVDLSRIIRLTSDFLTSRIYCIRSRLNPTTPIPQRIQALT